VEPPWNRRYLRHNLRSRSEVHPPFGDDFTDESWPMINSSPTNRNVLSEIRQAPQNQASSAAEPSSRPEGNVDITGHELQPLLKDDSGNYRFPNMPCGILPFFKKDTEKVWGCIETNRVGLVVTTPPTGTQDLIAIHKSDPGQRLALEIGKPIPDTGCACLESFKGQSLNERVFQQVVDVLKGNEYDVFLENPLATAEHETFEEHGVDLRRNVGKHNELVAKRFDFGPMEVKAKRGMITQQIYVAQLTGIEGVELSYQDKSEQKIAAFIGNKFYERGVWGTLPEFRAKLEQAKLDLSAAAARSLDANQFSVMQSEIGAFENRLNLIERIESNIDSLAKNEGQAKFPINYT